MYIRSNNTYRPATFQECYDDLPVGNYALNFDDMTGFFLTIKEQFELPKKIYGGTKFPERILSTYHARGKGMSVLLSGPKGTGKTVDAKLTCNICNMPVITIGEAYTGDQVANFIDEIKTPTIFFIDEFEKVYVEKEKRNFFLTVMDGVSKSRHLFILTSNSDDIGQFFDSRPGRVRYHRHYGGMTDEMIKEVIEDHLVHKEMEEGITEFVMGMSEISIDSLTCIIEECNIHHELPDEFISYFNVKNEPFDLYTVQASVKRAVPIAGLKGKALIQAIACARYANAYDDEEDHFDTCCVYQNIIYVTEWAQPFSDLYPGQVLSCTIYDDHNERITLNILDSDVESFVTNRSGFKLVTKDGRTITGAPCKSKLTRFRY